MNIDSIPLYKDLYALRDNTQVANLSRFFKCGKGDYGEGDIFLGIKVPTTRQVVKNHWKTTSLPELQTIIESPFHEARLAALLTLVEKYKHEKRNTAEQQKMVDFYLYNTAHINNWDLVDLSCHEILGRWLINRDRKLLYDLAQNGKTLWEKRIAIVTTLYFIRHNDLSDTLELADILLKTKEDLLQKAIGWQLREIGKHDGNLLRNYLLTRYDKLSRTTLRYAIEHFPEQERLLYLNRTFINKI